jgi:hypothetical protein
MPPPAPPSADSPQPSRRQMLRLLGQGAFGAGLIAAMGGGLAGLWWWMTAPSSRQPQIADDRAATSSAPQDTPPPAPPIVSRQAWGALPADHTAANEDGYFSAESPEGWLVYYEALPDAYQTAVIHHSVLLESSDLDSVRAIQKLHQTDRGWADVAYHYLVGKDGIIFEGRELGVRGTHVAGFNTGSVGICLIGDFTWEQPTPRQIDATRRLLQWLTYRLALTHLASHRDFNPETRCPGPNLEAYLAPLAESAGLALGTGGYRPLPT